MSTEADPRAAGNSHLSRSIDSKNEDLVTTDQDEKFAKDGSQMPVPRLQLNKVDLQLFGCTDDSASVSN